MADGEILYEVRASLDKLREDMLSAQDEAKKGGNKLADIAKGKASPKEFMRGINEMICEFVSRYREFDKTQGNPFQEKSGVEL